MTMTSARRVGAGPKGERKPARSLLWRILLFAYDTALVLFYGGLVYVIALRFLPVPGTILMIERAFQGEKIVRIPVGLADISPHMVRAVIAAEDSRFCRHWGIELDAIRAAVRYNATTGQKRGRVRGGSTISQQTAKNVFLWPQRSWLRKGLETWYTIAIEALWSKPRIMEAYLNSIEFGDGLFGVEAAAQARFHVSAKALSVRQAAALAAILPAPNHWNAVKPGRYVKRRIGLVQARMRIVARDGLAQCALATAR